MSADPIHPDDIDGLLAAIHVHLQAGRVGFNGLMSPSQMDYHSCWNALCQTISDVVNGSAENFKNEELTVIRNRVNELAEFKTPELLTYAIATTRYGREDMSGQ